MKNMQDTDLRVIEDFLPIGAIGAEATREKSVSQKHITGLHRWWARRPLVACRAAIYGSLVSVSRFCTHGTGKTVPDNEAREAVAEFIEKLCVYPGNTETINNARSHIQEDHKERLVAVNTSRNAPNLHRELPSPRVLDMFAGGGGIPFEALRLGCETFALDLNPVAHIVQLCSLVYPQRYSGINKSTNGATGEVIGGRKTWGGLENEVRYWGEMVLERTKNKISDLYPNIWIVKTEQCNESIQLKGIDVPDDDGSKELVPTAYWWTRTVRCKSNLCGAIVPLTKNTWLHTAKNRYVALKPILSKEGRMIQYKLVEVSSSDKLDFDPSAGSKRGCATCKFCGTVADIKYVKSEGCAGRIGCQMIGIVCSSVNGTGKYYFSANDFPELNPDESMIQKRIDELSLNSGVTAPNEPVPPKGALGFTPRLYGINKWKDLFTPRQLLCLMSFVSSLNEVEKEMKDVYDDWELTKAVMTLLAMAFDRLVDTSSNLCRFRHQNGIGVVETFARPFVSMIWDFAETNPLNSGSASWSSGLRSVISGLIGAKLNKVGTVQRGSATNLPYPDAFFDAIVTDPPYYDNVPYAGNSDFFYVWLKRTIGHIYPEHFATELTPKKGEAIAEPVRHDGNRERAKNAYEEMMSLAFSEANRVLKPGSPLVVVYAHKTTQGWTTLLNALRDSGFMVTEAWPLDTETPGRLRARNSAALASCIFLVTRKRMNNTIGSYETDVRPQLLQIVTNRVDELWKMGISGADLVIAAVGAGLCAFSRYKNVEYENGELVPAENFLTMVEGVVLEKLLGKIFGMDSSGVSSVDSYTRLYVIWRYTQKEEVDAGEAIVLTYGLAVELDGPTAISSGNNVLVEKNGSKYRIRDSSERGGDEKLGLPTSDGSPAPLIDILHRILWLVENSPHKIHKFLTEARPDREHLRLLAQVLAGTALEGSKGETVAQPVGVSGSEQATLQRLLTNWRTLIDRSANDPLFTT